MRWTQNGLRQTQDILASSSSLHKVSKNTGLTRGVLRRLRQRISLLNNTISMLAREAGLPEATKKYGQKLKGLDLSSKWSDWNDFAWQLRHAFYPLPRHDFLAPHDLYHPSG